MKALLVESTTNGSGVGMLRRHGVVFIRVIYCIVRATICNLTIVLLGRQFLA